MAGDEQNAGSIAQLLAGLLEPRDDIAQAEVTELADAGAVVDLTTQAGEGFTITVAPA